MRVRDAMTTEVFNCTPGRTLREAARLMTERGIGALVVMDPEQPGPGIVTERDIVQALGAGKDPDAEIVSDHLTSDAAFADSEWPLEEAAEAMAGGGFRHLLVVNGSSLEGIISMRDIMSVWRPAGPDSSPAGGSG